MTTKQKTVQTNYSAELVSVLVAEYAQLMGEHKDNKIVLPILSNKHGKTIPSIRAKLSSLKVYISANSADTDKPIVGDKIAKKEDIAQAISAIIGEELPGLEAATKQTLQTLLSFLLKVNKLLNEKEKKIESLIAEMLADDNAADNADNADNA